MTTLASNLEESVKDKLGYEDKHWETPRKLFANLTSLCILNNVPVKMDGKRIDRVKIHLWDSKLGKDYGLVEAKPVVKNERMYLSIRYEGRGIVLHPGDVKWNDGHIFCQFPKKGEVLIDATLAFGEEVNAL
jgi:hypothetical protein